MTVVTPRSRLRRAVIAALALHRGTPVSVGRLADLLWDNPPSSAAANLRSIISTLRREFDMIHQGESKKLRTVLHDGYQLDLSAHALDLDQFRALAVDARHNIRNGAASQAIGLCRQAMRLWRGPFGTGLPASRWLDGQAVAVNAAYRDVKRDYFTARLLANDWHLLTAEIQTLLGECVDSDRTWQLAMIAQFHANGAAAGLRSFEQCRQHYRETLGLDPPTETFRLHRAFLTRDSKQIGEILRAPYQRADSI
ncbi:AfsR/SARP family transcriptional regulator [Stackebrandtia nassauensis]|uniref:AfsR/SARP family transcriptional regulator n=1 Tax=Stackebrandtia nassauensis TaxID=283811 RepID=UPI003CC6EC23